MMLRTSRDVRDEFQRKGVSVAAWARANGFETNLVFEVLSGRKKGVRGQSHKIAVKLGLKAGEIVEDCDIATAINQ
jgi:gp16 family phage-associated protein